MTESCCDYRDHLCGCVCTEHPESPLHPLGERRDRPMASTRNLHLTFHCVTAEYVIELVTTALRASNWRPDRAHPCGCNPQCLCPTHAEIRAVEHYHPRARA